MSSIGLAPLLSMPFCTALDSLPTRHVFDWLDTIRFSMLVSLPRGGPSRVGPNHDRCPPRLVRFELSIKSGA